MPYLPFIIHCQVLHFHGFAIRCIFCNTDLMSSNTAGVSGLGCDMCACDCGGAQVVRELGGPERFSVRGPAPAVGGPVH